ncbi:MAG TPA: endonuclease/exonuclease/phosphatase family protein [Steroidobacteraceae bacterium]|nr:endonuclease/exonuclease/phosphatase family protein [Steroidobacteraceae bacterium]
MHFLRVVFFGLLALLPAALPGRGIASLPARPLRIATWNLEWLLDATTAQAARLACRDGLPAAVPCDAARELARDSADLAQLAAYARLLDADVIAFQEVQNAAIARRVFRGYRICLHAGAGLQQVGFAIRPQLAGNCGVSVEALALQGQARAGLQLSLAQPGGGSIELLALHLKSGCSHDRLESPGTACQLLAAQAQALGEWIAAQVARQRRFIVLGDFNRGAAPAHADRFWQLLHPESFQDSASVLPFANCSWGAPYREFIDHILVSSNLLAWLPPTPYRQFRFRNADNARYLLSDHCPLMVSLNVPLDL